MKNKIRIKVIYRNYKPIHQIYYSFQEYPPEGVEYTIPSPNKKLKKLYPIYHKYGDSKFVKSIIKYFQQKIFEKPVNDEAFDLLHYAQILPSKIDKTSPPFVIDLEHAGALLNFSEGDKKEINGTKEILTNKKCKKIIPLTEAAYDTVMKFFGSEFNEIKEKVEVIYPSLPNFFKKYGDSPDYSIIEPSKDKLNLLFVGNGVYRKGLHEVLEALKRIGSSININLYVISNIDKELKNKYLLPNVKYFDPKFKKEEIIKKFYLPADIFIMPTHGDSLGMAFLDALSCGTPVITTRQFATPEIVKDRLNGLFVSSERLYFEKYDLPSRTTSRQYLLKEPEEILVQDIIDKVKMLYNDRELLDKLKENAVKDFNKGGKFSIEVRNKKLLKIYNEAIQ